MMLFKFSAGQWPARGVTTTYQAKYSAALMEVSCGMTKSKKEVGDFSALSAAEPYLHSESFCFNKGPSIYNRTHIYQMVWSAAISLLKRGFHYFAFYQVLKQSIV